MRWRDPGRQRGPLQFVLVVLLAGLLVLWLFDRAERAGADLEAVALQLALDSLHYGLVIETQRALSSGGQASLEHLAEADPGQWGDVPVGPYLGVLGPREVADADAGSWYYDRAAVELVYRVLHPDRFETASGDRLRLRIVPEFEDLDGDGVLDPVKESAYALRWEVVEPYAWR
jgi:hypothetical protein